MPILLPAVRNAPPVASRTPSPHGPMHRIFQRAGLGEVRSVEPLAGGSLNRVTRVNGEYVLRCRPPQCITGSLEREVLVLRELGGRVFTPAVVAHGLDEMLGEYLIQRWIPGRSLLSAWLANPDVPTREWWLEQWIAGMKAIHELRYPAPGEFTPAGFQPAYTWQVYFESRLQRRVDRLMRVQNSNRALVLAAERYVRRNRGALVDQPCCLIHRDLHFGNILVDGPRLAAFLDFELAEVGPLDYELDTILRFLTAPGGFADPAQAGETTPVRFASVWVRLKRGYPELFAAPHLPLRLSLYALDRALSRLLQCHNAGWGREEAREQICQEMDSLLQGNLPLP